MNINKVMVGGACFLGAYLFADYKGYGVDDIIESFQERNEDSHIPPHKQGSHEVEGRERLGSISQFVVAGAEKDRVIDRAYGFRSTVGKKDIYLAEAITYLTVANSRVMYATKIENGMDVGFDIAELDFEMQAPEADMSDGKDDEQCKTPYESIENRGCETAGFVDTGFLQGIPGLGADNNENIGYKINKVDELFNKNNRCLLDFYVFPIINKELAQYNEELVGNNKYSALGSHLVRGTIRLQQFEGGVSPQNLYVNVDGEFIPDITLQDEFNILSRTDSQNIDAPIVPNDWCVLDPDGERAIEDLGDLPTLAHLGRETVAPYYNPSIGKIDPGNERFAPVDEKLFEDLKSEYGL